MLSGLANFLSITLLVNPPSLVSVSLLVYIIIMLSNTITWGTWDQSSQCPPALPTHTTFETVQTIVWLGQPGFSMNETLVFILCIPHRLNQ
jgi:hypothetical protein